MKTKKTVLRAIGLLCVLALGVCCVAIGGFADQVARRFEQSDQFYENSTPFYYAFQCGDYEEAFRRACACEETCKGLADCSLYVADALSMKARSAEMKGDYDVAAACYAKYEDVDGMVKYDEYAAFEPRLAYKQGKKAEAFRGYCEAFAEDAERWAAGEPARNSAPPRILMMEGSGRDAVLCPFSDYASFLSFMEAEFKAQGEPAENVPTMEFFRSQAEKEAAETE